MDDAVGIAENNVRAFSQEDWWRILWINRSLEDRIASVEQRTPRNLLKDRETKRHQLVVDEASGQVVGYGRWIMPGTRSEDWTEAQTPDVSSEDRERFEKQFALAEFKVRNDMDDLDTHITEAFARYGDGKEYLSTSHTKGVWSGDHVTADKMLELDYLATHPDHQRQGIASTLVASGVQVADRLGLPIMMVAMGGRAVSVYMKHGFKILEEKSQSLKPWDCDGTYDTYILWREPS